MLNISVSDLETMYLETVCSLDNQLIYFREILPDKTFRYRDKDSKEHLISFDKEEDLPKAPKLPYYLNVEGKYCVQIVRKPGRSLRQGVCEDNTEISMVGLGKRLTVLENTAFYLATSTLLKQISYPSFKDAMVIFDKDKISSVAIDRQICLTVDGFVFYKGEGIGKWEEDGFILTESGLNVKRHNKCLQ